MANESEPTLTGPALRAAVKETKHLLEQADRLYAPYGCPASGECCRLKDTQRQPWLFRAEWEVLVAFLEAEKRDLPPDRADGACPFLVEGRCSVYRARPFGCRTFFCHRATGPGRQPLEQTEALLTRLSSLHVAHDAGEPKPLLDWIAEARGPAVG